MKSNVNPFEPWRPAEAAFPRPLHAARPWRPPPVALAVEEPPFVEPINPPPRKKPLEESPRRNPPQSGNKPSPSQRPPVRLIVAIALITGIAGIIGVKNVAHQAYGAQVPLLALVVCALVLVGMAFDNRRNCNTRLSWMTAALALAGMAAWFLPTPHGINLWSAYRQVEALRTLPAGDVAGYQQGAGARRLLVEEFPSFAEDVRAAEQAWLRRTVDEAVEKSDRQLEVDPHAALADLHRLNAELTPLEHYASVRKDLDGARRRALQACLKTAAE